MPKKKRRCSVFCTCDPFKHCSTHLNAMQVFPDADLCAMQTLWGSELCAMETLYDQHLCDMQGVL